MKGVQQQQLQTKTTGMYHYTPVRMAEGKTVIKSNAGEDVEKVSHPYVAYRDVK